MSDAPSRPALEALERAVERASEPDDVLRAAVRILAAEPSVTWAGIAFLEDGALVLGPHAGAPDERRRSRVAVTFQGERVGELWVDGDTDRGLLDCVAGVVSPHVLIGWDTGGAAWEP